MAGLGLLTAPVAAVGVLTVPTAARAALQSTPEEPDARELLARAERVYSELRTLRARFTQTVEVPLLERSRTGSGVWYQKGRGRFKMEFADPIGDLIVADGTYLWLYYPTTNPGQAIRSTIEASPMGAQMVDLQGRIFEDARTSYDAEYVGEERVTGRAAHLIALHPRAGSPYRLVRVWVDTENYLVRKFEITEENQTVRTVVLGDLEPNVPIDDGTFHFVLPRESTSFRDEARPGQSGLRQEHRRFRANPRRPH
ncbi:MAG: outer membrane lipoprotein carrier protein LolA, partial [Gemmatimonadota bacterium]